MTKFEILCNSIRFLSKQPHKDMKTSNIKINTNSQTISFMLVNEFLKTPVKLKVQSLGDTFKLYIYRDDKYRHMKIQQKKSMDIHDLFSFLYWIQERNIHLYIN